MRTWWLATVGIQAIAMAGEAAAQTIASDQPVPAAATQASRTARYDAAFFAGFAPSTALDIARRVPGFSLDLGNSDTRGFAGAAGNVVINGARPSAKAESLETTLARIPARRVARVEVGPGDLYGSEYSTKSQVLNVVLSAEGGLDGNVTTSLRRIFPGVFVPDASASALIKRGASSINLAAGTGRVRQVDEGTDDYFALPSGAPIEFRRKENRYLNRDPYLSGSYALEQAADRSIRANARWSPSAVDLTQDNRVFTAGKDPHDDNLVQRYRNPVIELGGDVTRPLAGGALKVVALATRRKRDNRDIYTGRDGLLDEDASVVSGYDQRQLAKRNETIGRFSWSRSNLLGFSIEAGAEAVHNSLDSTTELYSIGAEGVRTRIDLPIDQAVVTEKRGEVYVTLGRNLSPALRIDGGLNVETSRLKVRGDTEAERALSFVKPNVAVDWKPGGGWHARASVRRTVAQLDFYDFISIAEIANDRVNAGNTNLRPQQSWEWRATLEKPVLGDGLVKIDAGLDRISDLQDIILTPEGYSAPGNLGDGRRKFLSGNVDAPLASLGLKGTRLKLYGQLQRTRVLDPISSDERNFSDYFPDWEWSAEVRRDAGALSMGFTVQHRDDFTFFRANETDAAVNSRPYATAFVEYRPDARTSITFDVDNATDAASLRTRDFYFPNRSNPIVGARELRERNKHVSVGLTLKRSFGNSGKPAATPAQG